MTPSAALQGELLHRILLTSVDCEALELNRSFLATDESWGKPVGDWVTLVSTGAVTDAARGQDDHAPRHSTTGRGSALVSSIL